MDPIKFEERMANAKVMFDYSVDLCFQQHVRGRFFILEHPAPASSWSTPRAQRLQQYAGVRGTNFDQCAVGLKSPSGAPMKKKTKLVSNIDAIHQLFGECQCSCTEPHRTIQGSDRGVKVSTWSQKYPREMCALMVRASET